MKKLILAMYSMVLFCSFSTDDPIRDLIKKLEEYTKKYPTEKVHLHLDKPFYASGDDIWFKAYVADARTTKLTSESNILYVDLVREDGVLTKRLKLPLEEGIAWGDFKLPDTITEGNYQLRAYTQLMRNSGREFFFQKNVKIGSKWNNLVSVNSKVETIETAKGSETTLQTNLIGQDGKPIVDKPLIFEWQDQGKTIKSRTKTDAGGSAQTVIPANAALTTTSLTINLGKEQFVKKVISIPSVSPKIDLQFLPEGGKMVANLPSKIAFKAINENGKGQDIEGIILDESGTEITSFKTSYLGMGSIYFIPSSGKNYTAKINSPNRPAQIFSLPKVENNGYVIQVTQPDSLNLAVKLMVSQDLLKNDNLNLVLHRDGLVLSSIQVSNARPISKFMLPISDLPTGVAQLTLLSPANLPILERLVFINNTKDIATIEVENLKTVYSPSEAINFNIKSKTPGYFSAAINREDLIQEELNTESNILASMLLKADIKGYIEKPNSYFLVNNQSSRENLDHLLLTHGWRNMDWKAINDDLVPDPKFNTEKGIKISGTITKNKKALPNSKISLMTNTDGLFLIDTLSDANGRFIFKDLVFPDSVKFIIQARSELGKKTVEIDLDTIENLKIEAAHNFAEVELNVNKKIENFLSLHSNYLDNKVETGQMEKSILLKQVTVISDLPNPAKNSKNLNGPGNADQVIDGESMINAPTVVGFLSSKLFRVVFKRGLPHTVTGGRYKVFLDGNEYDESFDYLNPEAIESVEVLISPSKFVLYKTPTIIITTKIGVPKWPIVKYAPGLITYKLKGYDNAREFYTPKFSTANDPNAEYRSTIYWKPNITIDESKTTALTFENAKQPGNYRIVVEGVTIEGGLVRKVINYKIQ